MVLGQDLRTGVHNRDRRDFKGNRKGFGRSRGGDRRSRMKYFESG